MIVIGASNTQRAGSAASRLVAIGFALGGMIALSSCGPVKPEAVPSPTAAAAAPVAPTPTATPVIEILKKLSPEPAPLHWSFIEGASVAAATQGAPSADSTFVPFTLTATPDAPVHRVGLSLPSADAARTLTVTVWVHSADTTNSMLELAALGEANAVTSYGVTYFDLAKATPVVSPVATPEQRMKGASAVKDGDWLKLSGPITVQPGSTGSVVIGLVSGGGHTFAATGSEKLTIGGITVTSK